MPDSHTDDATVVLIEPDSVLFIGDATGPDLYCQPVVYRAPGSVVRKAQQRALEPDDLETIRQFLRGAAGQ